MEKKEGMFQVACPAPIRERNEIVMAHGGGGRVMQQLIEGVFFKAFGNPLLAQAHDGTVIEAGGERLAFTTDSYVVRPLIFPGGDIGDLAVNGTVNDLAMCGARPLYLSAGFILEEGLSMDVLRRVVDSMRRAADKAGVRLVTGDTKVVDKGKGDGLYVNTAGIGLIKGTAAIHPREVRAGDAILINGDVGRHGMAVMAVREGLSFETTIESDTAPLAGLVGRLMAAGIGMHCLRDVTRGGLGAVLNEISSASGWQQQIDEALVPVAEEVHGACEILGLDPLYVACEGRFVAFVKDADADKALDIMKTDPVGAGAAIIGRVTAEKGALVTLRSRVGASRILDMLSGEQLPRIC
ncbi:MAG: hydrogenase expression/formation protein HypE [Verrucomicrobiae bacterium]|nr:hydrogenase expression/formation protein HypE [Verrucomicrobiae bacterium]